jgi:hypothetical protein
MNYEDRYLKGKLKPRFGPKPTDPNVQISRIRFFT